MTNTVSKVKYLETITNAFQIVLVVRQGDGLSLLLFNSVLENTVRELKLEEQNIKVITI